MGRILPSRQRIIIDMPFGKNLLNKINPQELLSYIKICHNKFDPVDDPRKDIMLGIEGINFVDYP